ncbi:Ribosome hibernation promoting factor OS=Streptomyces microflavus OX=1919 GN=hpf PE=3 SV=1 [Streptomyces microflavus]
MDRQRSSRWVVTSPTGEEEAKVTESEAPGDHRGLVQKGDAPPLKRGDPGTEFCVDIVVKGRKTEVPERFRKHVAEKLKLDKIQKFDGKVISLRRRGVQGAEPPSGRPSDRVEITLRSRGPVIRAEAAAGDPYAALDLATGKLEARLRKQHDKRYSRRGNGRLSAAEVGDVVPGVASFDEDGELVGEQRVELLAPQPVVVREVAARYRPPATSPPARPAAAGTRRRSWSSWSTASGMARSARS